METTNFTIQGTNIEMLPELFQKTLPKRRDNGHRYVSSSDQTLIYFWERFYFRIGSHLLVCVIFEFENDKRCHIEIVSGGGKAGTLSLTWGAENHSLNRVMKWFQTICTHKNNDWEIVHTG